MRTQLNNEADIDGWGALGLYLVVAAPISALFAWAMLSGPPFIYSLDTDFWEHSAVIREWMHDLWVPKNPHLLMDVGTPRYTPHYFFLAALGKTLDLDAITVLTISAVVNFLLLLAGIFLFFRTYFQNRYAPLLGLIVLLTFWGTGWTWSSVYQLRSLMYVGPYPSTFAFAMTFWCLWLQLFILREKTPDIRCHAALATMVAVVFASHLFNGAFAIATLLLLAMLYDGADMKARLSTAAAIVIGTGLSELWPYYSVFKVTLGVSGGDAGNWADPWNLLWLDRTAFLLDHQFYKPDVVLKALGPAMLGILCVGILACKRTQWFIVFGALVMLAPYIVNLFVRIPLGHRFLIFFVFYLHLSLVWATLTVSNGIVFKMKGHGNVFLRGATIGVLSLAIAYGAATGISRAFFDVQNRAKTTAPVPETVGKVVHNMPRDSVVLARHLLAWPIPTFGGKVISLYHNNPMVPDAKNRARDVDRFFDPNAPSEVRTGILRKYDVAFALIDVTDTPPEVLDYLSSVAVLRNQLGDLQMFQFRPLTAESR